MSGILHLLKLSLLVAVAFALSVSGLAQASGQAHVTIVVSEESDAYSEVAAAIRTVLEQRPGINPVVTVLPLQGIVARKIDLAREHPDLIVAVGVRAAQYLAAQNLSPPLLAALIPRQAFEKIARQRDYRMFSAVFLDQPPSRQMELIRLALPGRGRVGVVLGPESQDVLKALQAAAKESKFGLVAEKIGAAEELLPALQRVLAESDVLLAVPDPLVFNKGTVQSLLLTTYRYQDPVIGFSHAYVKAGALAAVYTTPEQAGKQAGEILVRVLGGKSWTLPPPEYPKYFSVSVNHQVARSLGISIEDEAALYQSLKRAVELE